MSGVIATFVSSTSQFGGSPKFSGVINGKLYADAAAGGMPQLMIDNGYDYLDTRQIPSGYPGDLFGLSIALRGSTLIVGSPFSAYSGVTPLNWTNVANNTSRYNKPSGTLIGFNGGAGSVYVFSKTGNGTTPYGKTSDWECVQKLRPSSINIGQDNSNPVAVSSIIGTHSYTSGNLVLLTKISDQFGYSVDVDADMLAVGSPGHDFSNYVIESQSPFMRKAFNNSFDITKLTTYDLGTSGSNLLMVNSGVTVLNNGAVFTFENRIVDWENKTQKWELVQKVVPQGYNSRLQGGTENDYFGYDVAIDRVRRSDADYTLAVGVPYHKYATSGNHTSSQPLTDAGAAHVYNGMLRRLPPSFADKDSWIQGKLFGNLNASGDPYVRIGFTNNQEYSQAKFASGIVYANYNGDIFLEVSGQDKVKRGYITHRPYIESIDGSFLFGTEQNSGITLFVEGKPHGISGNMPLFSNGANSATVYSTLGMYEQGVLGLVSGVPSGLTLYLSCPAPVTISQSGLTLSVSGIGLSTDSLTMRIRGK